MYDKIPVVKAILAAPMVIWAANLVAIALGNPIMTPPSAKASNMV